MKRTVSSIPQSKNFPLELVNEVLNYCQSHELCAVALTNSYYGIEAERVLYRSIALNCSTAKARLRTAPCLSTLAKVQSKVDMVISFELIYSGTWLLPPSELGQLCSSLVAMRSLKHLKLHFSWREGRDVIPSLLIPVLKSCTFSLATLYIPSLLLGEWIFSHNQLQVLGMLEFDFYPLHDSQLSICKRLSAQNSSPTTVFVIAAPFNLELDRIMAFPVFSESVNTRWSAKDVADSIPWTNAHSITYFILLVDSLSEATVHDVLTSLAEHFVYLKSILLFIDPRIHLSPSSFTCLHKFPHLETFDIDSNHSGLDKLTYAPFHEDYLDLAGSWATNCPKLYEIAFPNGWMARRDESGNWVRERI